MSNAVPPVFSRTVQESTAWLDEIADEMGGEDQQAAYHALRAVFFTLRDRMPTGEAAHLASQLPSLLRGVFYESYRPSDAPEKYRDRAAFLEHVRTELELGGADDAEAAVRAVLTVLGRRISEGQFDQVRHLMPAEIQALWPA